MHENEAAGDILQIRMLGIESLEGANGSGNGELEFALLVFPLVLEEMGRKFEKQMYVRCLEDIKQYSNKNLRCTA